MTLGTFWSTFGKYFKLCINLSTQTTPKVPLTIPCRAQGHQKEVILDTKSDPKSIKNRVWNTMGSQTDFVMIFW